MGDMNQLMVPVFVAAMGAGMYGFAGNSKVQEMGRLLFFSGVFWIVYALSGHALRF